MADDLSESTVSAKMTKTAILRSKRLLLRRLLQADAEVVQQLAGNRAIADTTLRIPHPYEDGMAEQWIANLDKQIDVGRMAAFAIESLFDQRFFGVVSLDIDPKFNRAALGYWIGEPHWGQGYCTEAASLLIQYGFEELQLHRIFATHLKRNPASGRVMQKIGMQREGLQRGHTTKWDEYEDLVLYGVLRDDWSVLAN